VLSFHDCKEFFSPLMASCSRFSDQFVRLVYSHTDEELCRREVERVYRLILDERVREGMVDFNIIGPVPTFAFRARGRYRWQLFLRGPDSTRMLSRFTLPRGWTIDVDPVGMV
jgi:primosomal protein N' (replication factor Y)